MALPFDDQRLPVDVEVGAHGGPKFQTTVTMLGNGSEQRNSDWSEQRCEFDVGYGISSFDDLAAVKAHFYARRGRWRSFPFKDWTDYTIEDEVIGTGTGAVSDFQITKTYEPSGFPYVRDITRPVSGTLLVYINGVLKTLSTHYTVGLGLIHFLSAPAAAAVITATCEFDIPMRYDTDKFDQVLEAFNAGSVPSLPLVEVLE